MTCLNNLESDFIADQGQVLTVKSHFLIGDGQPESLFDSLSALG